MLASSCAGSTGADGVALPSPFILGKASLRLSESCNTVFVAHCWSATVSDCFSRYGLPLCQ
jgi:hypothetical protein